MSYNPSPPTPDKKTFELADQLSKLEISSDINVFAPQIIDILRGSRGRFITIDERPGYFNNLDGRFSMVRQVRNHSVWGPKLFASFEEPKPRVKKTPGVAPV